MSGLGILIPIAIGLGLLALGAFIWSVRSGQYEDLEGAGERILEEGDGRPNVGTGRLHLPD
ncbi:MAG: cbb3-type cytochrome oxidase assembly protein CcoS [Devosia sp.]